MFEETGKLLDGVRGFFKNILIIHIYGIISDQAGWRRPAPGVSDAF